MPNPAAPVAATDVVETELEQIHLLLCVLYDDPRQREVLRYLRQIADGVYL